MEKISIKLNDKNMYILNRTFEEYHGLTLACITLNEAKDIVPFLTHIRPIVNSIVMVDGGSTDATVELALPLADTMKIVPFEGHLGNQKNMAIALSFTDWTLFLDPDERLTPQAIAKIPEWINQDEYDCYSFPRREFLSGTENAKPFPDYQDRLFRTYCRYVRPIHHELVGYKKKYIIPVNQGIEIIHSKSNERHNARNVGHRCFELHYKHEMSYPGTQLKDSFIKEFPWLNKKVQKDEML